MACGGCNRSYVLPKEPIKAPQMLPDGTIKLPEGDDTKIEGFIPDADDPSILRPLGVSCSYRVSGMTLQQNGTYALMHVCRHSKCEHRSKPVTNEICSGCPLRE